MSLQLTSVHKHYDDNHVLRGINVTMEKGEFLALLGPSGCGKTTLLQSIAGLTSITKGEIRIEGEIVSTPEKEVPIDKRQIGMVFQDFALWPHMTVFEIVAFGLKLKGVRGKDLKKRVVETLSIFHMENYLTYYPHELSGGQKQRIAMARAIAPNPRLILMDEPLSALDAGLREEMRIELVRIFKQLNVTVIYVTHDQTEAMSMADRIVILKDGLCEQIGSPETLYNEPVSAYVAKFMGAANLLHQNGVGELRFIRPEDVGIGLQRSGSVVSSTRQWVAGVITVRSYQGSRYRYYVKTKDYEEEIEVTDPAKYGVGESVVLHLPDEKCKSIREEEAIREDLVGAN